MAGVVVAVPRGSAVVVPATVVITAVSETGFNRVRLRLSSGIGDQRVDIRHGVEINSLNRGIFDRRYINREAVIVSLHRGNNERQGHEGNNKSLQHDRAPGPALRRKDSQFAGCLRFRVGSDIGAYDRKKCYGTFLRFVARCELRR